MELKDLMRRFIDADSTDLHVAKDNPPFIRLHGRLIAMPETTVLDAENIEKLTIELAGEEKFAKLKKENELDMALTVEGNRRIRINFYIQQGSIAWALRLLPFEFFPLDKLGLPAQICEMVCGLKKGLVLVTGATGSGKSTTLASLINKINETREEHIFTIEDPVEYRHFSKKCFVSQREVGEDTESFPEALRRVLREDPDIVLIGEMRDKETMEAALTLAETGHLTFGTLHTSDAVQTVTRIIGAFPPSEQTQIRTQLATTLQVAFSQQLVPWENGEGRSLAAEILVASPAVKAMIREDKIHQISSAMQTGGMLGMKTMNQSLQELVHSEKITKERAVAHAIDKEDMQRRLSSRI
jgi:twitching motility protein PilT